MASVGVLLAHIHVSVFGSVHVPVLVGIHVCVHVRVARVRVAGTI